MSLARYNAGDFNSGVYSPFVVDIDSITKGSTTSIITVIPHEYKVGNLVLFSIPNEWGIQQLNQKKAYVIDVPDDLEIVVDIDSTFFNDFVTPSPPSFVVLDPAQIIPAGDGNFSQAFAGDNPRLPRTIQGAYVNQPS